MDGTLPFYSIEEPAPDGSGSRWIGEAQGIEAAERACLELLREGECGHVQLAMGDRVVEEASLDPDTGAVRWLTYGKRRDLR